MDLSVESVVRITTGHRALSRTCLVRRSEIMQLHGHWTEAVAEAEHARDRLSKPAGQPALGAAFYQLAELHRLRGDFADAERAYTQASEHGRKPQPGLALLRLTQHRVEVALAAIRPAVGDLQRRGIASRMLHRTRRRRPDGADAAAACLATNADDVDTPFLRALSAQAAGAVLLARGEHVVALASLERALGGWLELEAPYEAARTRVLIASVCLALGDNDTARMETDAARKVFEELGARPDLAQLDAGRSDDPPSDTPAGQPGHGEAGAASGLTRRETEVIGLIATGKTNRQIAKQLFISEKTVAHALSRQAERAVL